MFRTAESCSPMHPDKLCDIISDTILDAYLAQDPDSRVAIETMGGHGAIYITGELTTGADINIKKLVRGIVGGKYRIQVNIVRQSPEIAQGVDTGGAGDQGIMTGYACNETPEYMPKEVMLARNLNRFIYSRYPFDGKTQATLKDGELYSVVASFQNTPAKVLRQMIKEFFGEANYEIFVNPAGDWDIGSFDADTGLTGRKLVVDNYGPRIPIGGGSYSGKDPSKVDRSAAYMARRIAVDYLKKFNAAEVYVRLAYAIGHPEPLEVTAIVDGREEKVTGYDLAPNGIIGYLRLKQPIYAKTARWGAYGNGFYWDS